MPCGVNLQGVGLGGRSETQHVRGEGVNLFNTDVPADVGLFGPHHSGDDRGFTAPLPFDVLDEGLLELKVVAHRYVVLVGFLGDGHAWVPFHVLVGSKADADSRPVLFGGSGQPLRRLEAEGKGGVGGNGARVLAVDVHRVIINLHRRVGSGVVDAAAFGGGAAIFSKAGEGGVDVPCLAVVELDALVQVEAPGIFVDLLPARGGAGRHNPQVVTRLPGQGVLQVGPGDGGVQRPADAEEGVEVHRLFRYHQDYAVLGSGGVLGQWCGRGRRRCGGVRYWRCGGLSS